MSPPHVVVGCTGSVASVKVLAVVDSILALSCKPEVKLVATDHALHFFDRNLLKVPLYTDKEEWDQWQAIGDEILHIGLRNWADVMVIAPLDANTLAKIANGICDNLLTCVVRAWDLEKPLLFAPAMNTVMYEHPITDEQINRLRNFGYREIPSISKKLACGDTGIGAMAEVEHIAVSVEAAIMESELQDKPLFMATSSTCSTSAS